MDTTYDLVAIGGGTAGMTVTRLLARAGWRVAIVERDRTGGDCLFTGCVPTKAMIEAAADVYHARKAEAYGLSTTGELNFAAVKARVAEAQRLAGADDSPEALRADGVDVIQGEAVFTGPGTLSVDGTEVHARYFAICTGSKAVAPPIEGLDTVPFDTNVEAVAWDSLPGSLAILGGGAIGVEFAQMAARLGSQVSVIEAAERLLPAEEPEASRVIEACFEREGIAVHANSRLVRAERTPSGIELAVSKASGEERIETERLLVAIGRRPRTQELGLETARIEVNRSGVVVDRQLRTSNPRVFAVGDVAGGPQFTHVAEDQARFVANVLSDRSLLRRRATWNARVVPRVTFSDPEVASVGLTAAQAKEQFRRTRAWRLPLSKVDRAITMGRTEGFIQVVTAPGWPGRVPRLASRVGPEIVGASIVGPAAGELLAPIVMAMRARLPAGLVAWNMQAYPTLALGLRQVLAPMFERGKSR